jgi:hypothetical protein
VLPPPPPLPLLAGSAVAPLQPRSQGRAELLQAVRQPSVYACAPQGDPTIAQQYAELVNLVGYLQGDVAEALEAPAREILASGESPQVRELAAAILAAVATLRRGGPP